MKRFTSLLLPVVLTIALAAPALAQEISGKVYYKLSTEWKGAGKVLDVVNDGKNTKVELSPAADASGQLWLFTDVGDGYYQLTTQWRGREFALSVNPDKPANLVPYLAPAEDNAAQHWKVAKQADGSDRITNKARGEKFALDIVNDGKADNQPTLAKTEDVAGQAWKLAKTKEVAAD